MILKVFCIYDSAIEAYNQPFFMLTQKEAIRAFTNLANDPESKIHQNPTDYHLYFIGAWDNATGYLTQDTKLLSLGDARQYQTKETVENVKQLFPAKELKSS